MSVHPHSDIASYADPGYDYAGGNAEFISANKFKKARKSDRIGVETTSFKTHASHSSSLPFKMNSPYLSSIFVLKLSIGRQTTESEKYGEKS